jgi:GNAT superfamily N-acetyltransferase
MKLRLATVADIDAMHRLRLAVRENRLRDPSRVTPDDYVARLERDGRGWLVEEGTGLCGFGVADRVRGEIWALFVAPGQERRGVGRQLLAAMTAWLEEAGVRTIRLSTEPGTRAERFYLIAGWQQIGVTPEGESILAWPARPGEARDSR